MSYTTNDRVRAALLAYHSGDMNWDSQDEELMRLALAAAYPALTEEVERLREENERLRASVEDAARYRYLRDHCSSHYPMTHEQPAEWSIGWEFQQSTPAEAYGSFDKWIDADIEAMRQRQDELDAEVAS